MGIIFNEHQLYLNNKTHSNPFGEACILYTYEYKIPYLYMFACISL